MDRPVTIPLARPSRALIAAIAAFAVSAIPAAAVLAQSAARPFVIKETGRSFGSLQEAIDAVGVQRGTINIAPGIYKECAVQLDGEIAYVAQEPGSAVFDGVACEGKAALVLRGRSAEITGLTFRNISVDDGNGAGIRLENGNLVVAYTRFEDSQQGILTADNPEGRITISRSNFSGLGTCENSAGCAHSLYIGNYGELSISQSRFERGTGGHYVKARSRLVMIRGNSFDDANGRSTNYMIDLPAGSRGLIENNWFVQGRDKENYSAFIALGAEEILHSSDGLTVSNNEARFVPGLSRSSAFLADWTGSRITMSGNRLMDGVRQYEER